MTSPEKPAGIAFFDFDKTILKVDSGPIYGFRIYRDGLARTYPSFRAAFAGLGYKMGFVRRRTVAKLGVAEYEGLTKEQIETWMRQAYPRLIKPYLSEPIVARIREHQESGFHTAIISASPPFFIAEAALDLGMNYFIGSEMEFTEGVCTGMYAGKYLGGAMKLEKARQQAVKVGVDLADCWFYTDHVADLPLMEAVGNPVAVSPEEKLRAIALERGWTILEHED